MRDHIHLAFDFRVCFSRDVDRGYALRSMETPNFLPCHFANIYYADILDIFFLIIILLY